jgi:ABC-type Fe3+ transport system permease subunit
VAVAQFSAHSTSRTYEDAAIAALLIVGAGLVPVLLLATISRKRPENEMVGDWLP